MLFSVIPAQAGIQSFQITINSLDSGFHRSDDFLRNHHPQGIGKGNIFHQTVKGGRKMAPQKDKKQVWGELTRRDFLYRGGMGAAGIALAGIPHYAYGAEKKPKYGGRLRIGERFGPTGLDAHKNQYIIDFFNYVLMYNALTIMGPLPDAKMHPDLAKSWEISKDGREYIFSLREGVKFHHGKELDSADVKYSIERVMNPATRSPRAFAYGWIDSVTIIDKYHIKIQLKEPYGPLSI